MKKKNVKNNEVANLTATVREWRNVFLELSRGEITFSRASEIFRGVFNTEEKSNNNDFEFELDIMWQTCGPQEPSKTLERLKKEIQGIEKSIQKVKDQIQKQRNEKEEKRRARARRLTEKEREREMYGYGMWSLYGGSSSTRNQRRQREKEEEQEQDGGGFWGMLGMDYETKLRGLEEQSAKLRSQLKRAQRDLLSTKWVESSYKDDDEDDFS